MNYGQLLAKLYELTPSQLQDTVTVYTPDGEYYPVHDLDTADSNHGILDDGHAYLDVAGS